MSVIFPRYYLLGYGAGTAALALAVYFAISRGARGWWSGTALLLAVALALTLYAGLVVQQAVNAVRQVYEEPNPDPASKAEFDRLHRLSVTLNGCVLILDLLALAGTAGALSRHG